MQYSAATMPLPSLSFGINPFRSYSSTSGGPDMNTTPSSAENHNRTTTSTSLSSHDGSNSVSSDGTETFQSTRASLNSAFGGGPADETQHQQSLLTKLELAFGGDSSPSIKASEEAASGPSTTTTSSAAAPPRNPSPSSSPSWRAELDFGTPRERRSQRAKPRDDLHTSGPVSPSVVDADLAATATTREAIQIMDSIADRIMAMGFDLDMPPSPSPSLAFPTIPSISLALGGGAGDEAVPRTMAHCPRGRGPPPLANRTFVGPGTGGPESERPQDVEQRLTPATRHPRPPSLTLLHLTPFDTKVLFASGAVVGGSLVGLGMLLSARRRETRLVKKLGEEVRRYYAMDVSKTKMQNPVSGMWGGGGGGGGGEVDAHTSASENGTTVASAATAMISDASTAASPAADARDRQTHSRPPSLSSTTFHEGGLTVTRIMRSAESVHRTAEGGSADAGRASTNEPAATAADCEASRSASSTDLRALDLDATPPSRSSSTTFHEGGLTVTRITRSNGRDRTIKGSALDNGLNPSTRVDSHNAKNDGENDMSLGGLRVTRIMRPDANTPRTFQEDGLDDGLDGRAVDGHNGKNDGGKTSVGEEGSSRAAESEQASSVKPSTKGDTARMDDDHAISDRIHLRGAKDDVKRVFEESAAQPFTSISDRLKRIEDTLETLPQSCSLSVLKAINLDVFHQKRSESEREMLVRLEKACQTFEEAAAATKVKHPATQADRTTATFSAAVKDPSTSATSADDASWSPVIDGPVRRYFTLPPLEPSKKRVSR